MQKRLTVGLMVVLGFLALRLSSIAVVLPPPVVKTITLTWDYPQMSTEIVFNVYHSTSLMIPIKEWSLITNVINQSCVLAMQEGAHFFSVTASNLTTRMESSSN
jgi:hypothetical protein